MDWFICNAYKATSKQSFKLTLSSVWFIVWCLQIDRHVAPFWLQTNLLLLFKLNILEGKGEINTIQFIALVWSNVASNLWGAHVAQWIRSLDLTTHTSLSPIRCGFATSFVNYKKGAVDSQPQGIKLTSCLPRLGGSLQVLRLPPQLKLVAMIPGIAEILLKVA